MEGSIRIYGTRVVVLQYIIMCSSGWLGSVPALFATAVNKQCCVARITVDRYMLRFLPVSYITELDGRVDAGHVENRGTAT